MKLKFINLLLASVLLAGSVQIFTSCKDNEADLYQNLREETLTLNDRLDKDLKKNVNDLLDSLKEERNKRIAKDNDLKEDIKAANQRIDSLNTELGKSDLNGMTTDQINNYIINIADSIANLVIEDAGIATDLTTINNAISSLDSITALIDTLSTVNAGKIVDLEIRIDSIVAAIANVDSLERFMNKWDPVLPTIQKNASDALAKANKNEKRIDTLLNRVIALEQDSAYQKAQIDAINNKLKDFVTKDKLKLTVDSLRAEAAQNFKDAKDFTKAMVDSLGDTLNVKIGELRKDINDLEDKLDKKANQSDLDSLQKKYESLKEAVDKNTKDIKEVSEALQKLNTRVEEVAGRVNGLILQQTDNAVFGTFNLPCGINSMMLVGWWGKVVNTDGLEFPTADAEYGYLVSDAKYGQEGYYKYIGLTEDDIARIGVKPEKVTDRYLMARNEDGKGILGTVYMTVNPSNASLEGKTFNIVNSLGKALPVEIKPVPSNKELKFGYTRGGTANGFYEAQALINVDEATLNQLRITLNPNLKNTVKNIINEGRNAINVNTIAKLGDAIYDQLNGILPALAISCSWNDSETGAMQVNTNYGLATAAIHARNFFFFTNLDGKLTTLPNLPNYSELKERFDAWFDEVAGKVVIKLNTGDFNINLGKIDVNIKKPTVTVNVSKGITADINATAKKDVLSFNITIDGEDEEAVAKDVEIPVTGKVTITPKDMEDFVKDIEASIKAALDDSMDQLADDFTDSINEQLQNVANKIADSVKDLFGTMETNINGQIKDVLNYIQSTVDGKIDALGDRFSNLYNKVEDMIGRLNDVLTEPSHYVQPVLLYNSDSKIGLLSTDAYHPNVFKTSSAEAAVALIPTTYTLETIVPVYQKYVAVTNVWKNGQVGGATQTDVLKDANSEGYMNTVCPAQRHTVALKLKKGYTYEIVYQAMDYDGYVSGSKYYVTVK